MRETKEAGHPTFTDQIGRKAEKFPGDESTAENSNPAAGAFKLNVHNVPLPKFNFAPPKLAGDAEESKGNNSKEKPVIKFNFKPSAAAASFQLSSNVDIKNNLAQE